jgi:hypothetical protein
MFFKGSTRIYGKRYKCGYCIIISKKIFRKQIKWGHGVIRSSGDFVEVFTRCQVQMALGKLFSLAESLGFLAC